MSGPIRYLYTHEILKASESKELCGNSELLDQSVDKSRRVSIIMRDVHPSATSTNSNTASSYKY